MLIKNFHQEIVLNIIRLFTIQLKNPPVLHRPVTILTVMETGTVLTVI